MIRVKWCRECGRLGAFNFAFCPWCGREFVEKPDGEAILDRAFDRLGDGLKSGSGGRLDDLERRLSELERDLGDFIDGAAEGELGGNEAIPIPDHLPGGP